MQRMDYKTPAAVTLLTLGAAAGIALVATQGAPAEAADHLDPPARTNPDAMPPGTDRNADIADVFAWVRGSGASRTAVLAMSFGGPNVPAAGQTVPCDRNVVYSIHIDSDGDTALDPTSTIEMRLGEDSEGNCFYRITGAGDEPIDGTVGFTRRAGGVSTYVGNRADAFFFDLTGFQTTLMTGTLSFVSDRDFFAAKNTPVMVVELPIAEVSPADAPYRVWGTTARFGS
jgi:hypothetical protein